MTYPDSDHQPRRRDTRVSRDRNIAVIATVVAVVAVLVATVLAVLLVRQSGQASAAAPASTATVPAKSKTAAAKEEPAVDAEPRTKAGVQAAAAVAFDAYAAEEYGEFWDTWSAKGQKIVSRRDYVRRYKECPALAGGIRFEVKKVAVSGDRAKVRVSRLNAIFTYDFIYENGAWKYVPPAEMQQQYRTRTVDEIVASERASGTCK
ncbi:hypothetical protein ACGFIV_01025 [Sphaerisporangium sp. NPDC049003]|uniref:hypothetical protein n=1 Tax=Sphaerisporangium sp. NPDC049003 TaxID=3364517 RepID=UPI003715498E